MYFLMFLYVRNYNKKVSVLLIELSVEHVYKRALTLSVLLVVFPFQVTTFISDEWSYYMHENSFTNISEKLCMVIFFGVFIIRLLVG